MVFGEGIWCCDVRTRGETHLYATGICLCMCVYVTRVWHFPGLYLNIGDCFPSHETGRRSELPLLLLGWVSLIRLLPIIVPPCRHRNVPHLEARSIRCSPHPTLSHLTQEGVFLIASISSPLNCLCTPVSATLPVKLACATSLTNPNAPTVLFQ